MKSQHNRPIIGVSGLGLPICRVRPRKHIIRISAARSERAISCVMPSPFNPRPRSHLIWRAVIEMAFIIFLFYSNLLMGEFNRAAGQGKTLIFALRDIFTASNLLIALISAMIGYVVFEFLRRKL